MDTMLLHFSFGVAIMISIKEYRYLIWILFIEHIEYDTQFSSPYVVHSEIS